MQRLATCPQPLNQVAISVHKPNDIPPCRGAHAAGRREGCGAYAISACEKGQELAMDLISACEKGQASSSLRAVAISACEMGYEAHESHGGQASSSTRAVTISACETGGEGWQPAHSQDLTSTLRASAAPATGPEGHPVPPPFGRRDKAMWISGWRRKTPLWKN